MYEIFMLYIVLFRNSLHVNIHRHGGEVVEVNKVGCCWNWLAEYFDWTFKRRVKSATSYPYISFLPPPTTKRDMSL